MLKINELSMETRTQIVILNKTSHFQSKIAEIMGVSKTGVATTLKRFVETKSFNNRERSGRPRKTSENDYKYIKIIFKRNRFKTAPVIGAEVNNILSQPISTNTVKRRLVEFDYVGRVTKKKPLLRDINKRKCLVFAQNYKD